MYYEYLVSLVLQIALIFGGRGLKETPQKSLSFEFVLWLPCVFFLTRANVFFNTLTYLVHGVLLLSQGCALVLCYVYIYTHCMYKLPATFARTSAIHQHTSIYICQYSARIRQYTHTNICCRSFRGVVVAQKSHPSVLLHESLLNTPTFSITLATIYQHVYFYLHTPISASARWVVGVHARCCCNEVANFRFTPCPTPDPNRCDLRVETTERISE